MPPEESLKSKITNVWFPAIGGILIFLVSLYWDLTDTGEKTFWLQRSGAVLTVMGAYIAFHESRENTKFINGELFINNELPYKAISLIYVVVGTLLWGYGDIPFK